MTIQPISVEHDAQRAVNLSYHEARAIHSVCHYLMRDEVERAADSLSAARVRGELVGLYLELVVQIQPEAVLAVAKQGMIAFRDPRSFLNDDDRKAIAEARQAHEKQVLTSRGIIPHFSRMQRHVIDAIEAPADEPMPDAARASWHQAIAAVEDIAALLGFEISPLAATGMPA